MSENILDERVYERNIASSRERNTENACERMMNIFFALDKGEVLPLRVTLHLLGCKKCRTTVRRMFLAEKLAMENLHAEDAATLAQSQELLQKVYAAVGAESANAQTEPVSMMRWIASGVTMIASMVAFYTLWHKNITVELNLTFAIVFAACVSVYCALFIGCHMDFFVKKINTGIRNAYRFFR
ncbi:MAG: hypothetical protein Ta2A_26050 [Treponemataceae bacterium]|nr:MAG: hypothetical protein Ta2A_26050 [Treponemataceae bacterium]